MSEQIRSLPETQFTANLYFSRTMINSWILRGILCFGVFRVLYNSLLSLYTINLFPNSYSMNFEQAKTIANVSLSKGQ